MHEKLCLWSCVKCYKHYLICQVKKGLKEGYCSLNSFKLPPLRLCQKSILNLQGCLHRHLKGSPSNRKYSIFKNNQNFENDYLNPLRNQYTRIDFQWLFFIYFKTGKAYLLKSCLKLCGSEDVLVENFQKSLGYKMQE